MRGPSPPGQFDGPKRDARDGRVSSFAAFPTKEVLTTAPLLLRFCRGTVAR